MASLERRILQLEQRHEARTDISLAEAIREGRLRAERGETLPETPITQEMLDDPVHGEMWRKIRDGRERVRKAREVDNGNA